MKMISRLLPMLEYKIGSLHILSDLGSLMEPYTLDRKFLKRDVIDRFHSIIWTERYYGDSEVELVVPANNRNDSKIATRVYFLVLMNPMKL